MWEGDDKMMGLTGRLMYAGVSLPGGTCREHTELGLALHKFIIGNVFTCNPKASVIWFVWQRSMHTHARAHTHIHTDTHRHTLFHVLHVSFSHLFSYSKINQMQILFPCIISPYTPLSLYSPLCFSEVHTPYWKLYTFTLSWTPYLSLCHSLSSLFLTLSSPPALPHSLFTLPSPFSLSPTFYLFLSHSLTLSLCSEWGNVWLMVEVEVFVFVYVL